MCSQFSRRYSPFPVLAGVATALLLVLASKTADAQLSVEDFPDLELTDFSYVNQATRDAYRDEALQKSTEPFRIFDNLYYVGIQWVASYLLVTDDGLILIDSLHDPYIETGIEHIRALGFDPADIKYVVGTHGHFDHVGGHAYYQEHYGSRVGMAAADWKRAQTDANQNMFGMDVADVDWVIQDGEQLELGGQTMTFYVTPGHTEGVLSMEFEVRDGSNRYRTVIFGGGSVRGNDYWMRQTALGNIRRFQALAAQAPPYRVRIAGHPSGPGGTGGASLFELQRQLANRGPGDPHPFVNDASVFRDYLSGAAANIEQAILATP
ncbi:MAG: MBL fold metallo-hydrolase [Candidatus Rariloculaceae bacterium]